MARSGSFDVSVSSPWDLAADVLQKPPAVLISIAVVNVSLFFCSTQHTAAPAMSAQLSAVLLPSPPLRQS